ncbi:hypothetical protein F7U66_01340 [Vibrio parahaemolyticus]|nr:hypothetical protein [Vibrio parahaemolyticus]
METIPISDLDLQKVKAMKTVNLSHLELDDSTCGMVVSIVIYKGQPRLRLEGNLLGFEPFNVGHYPISRSGLKMISNDISALDKKTIHEMANMG